jgi:hypothetical protein
MVITVRWNGAFAFTIRLISASIAGKSASVSGRGRSKS